MYIFKVIIFGKQFDWKRQYWPNYTLQCLYSLCDTFRYRFKTNIQSSDMHYLKIKLQCCNGTIEPNFCFSTVKQWVSSPSTFHIFLICMSTYFVITSWHAVCCFKKHPCFIHNLTPYKQKSFIYKGLKNHYLRFLLFSSSTINKIDSFLQKY